MEAATTVLAPLAVARTGRRTDRSGGLDDGNHLATTSAGHEDEQGEDDDGQRLGQHLFNV